MWDLLLWAGAAGAEGDEEGSSRMVGHCFVVGGMATGGEVIEEEEGRRGGGLAEAPVAVVLKEGEQEGSVLDFIYCT